MTLKKEGYELTSCYKYISLLNDPYIICYKAIVLLWKYRLISTGKN